MQYRGPGDGGKEELLAAIAHDDYAELCQAMVDAVFNLDDRQWLQSRYLELIHHPNWSVRALSATCLGHVATFYNRLDVAVVVPEIEELKADPRTRGYAETALDDIGMLQARWSEAPEDGAGAPA